MEGSGKIRPRGKIQHPYKGVHELKFLERNQEDYISNWSQNF